MIKIDAMSNAVCDAYRNPNDGRGPDQRLIFYKPRVRDPLGYEQTLVHAFRTGNIMCGWFHITYDGTHVILEGDVKDVSV